MVSLSASFCVVSGIVSRICDKSFLGGAWELLPRPNALWLSTPVMSQLPGVVQHQQLYAPNTCSWTASHGRLWDNLESQQTLWREKSQWRSAIRLLQSYAREMLRSHSPSRDLQRAMRLDRQATWGREQSRGWTSDFLENGNFEETKRGLNVKQICHFFLISFIIAQVSLVHRNKEALLRSINNFLWRGDEIVLGPLLVLDTCSTRFDSPIWCQRFQSSGTYVRWHFCSHWLTSFSLSRSRNEFGFRIRDLIVPLAASRSCSLHRITMWSRSSLLCALWWTLSYLSDLLHTNQEEEGLMWSVPFTARQCVFARFSLIAEEIALLSIQASIVPFFCSSANNTSRHGTFETKSTSNSLLFLSLFFPHVAKAVH